MEQELEMRPIMARKSNAVNDETAEQDQRRELKENGEKEQVNNGKKRSKLRMGAIITALFVRPLTHHSPLPTIHPSPN